MSNNGRRPPMPPFPIGVNQPYPYRQGELPHPGPITRNPQSPVPNAPRDGGSPFLPGLPPGVQPYDPPAAAPPPPTAQPFLGQSEDSFETQSITIPWPQQTLTPDAFVSVYTTKRRWRACDVFIEVIDDITASNAIILTVQVLAISQAGSTLVETGRFPVYEALAGVSRWLAAARTSGERYEIRMHLWRPTVVGPPPNGKLKVTIACTDEMTEPPKGVGVIPAARTYNSLIRWAFTGILAPPAMRLIGYSAVIPDGVTGARFLVLADSNSSALNPNTDPANYTPQAIMPMGSVAGDGFTTFETDAQRFFFNPRLDIASSLAGPIVWATDCAVQAWVK